MKINLLIVSATLAIASTLVDAAALSPSPSLRKLDRRAIEGALVYGYNEDRVPVFNAAMRDEHWTTIDHYNNYIKNNLQDGRLPPTPSHERQLEGVTSWYNMLKKHGLNDFKDMSTDTIVKRCKLGLDWGLHESSSGGINFVLDGTTNKIYQQTRTSFANRQQPIKEAYCKVDKMVDWWKTCAV